jgi:hypothetical protein
VTDAKEPPFPPGAAADCLAGLDNGRRYWLPWIGIGGGTPNPRELWRSDREYAASADAIAVAAAELERRRGNDPPQRDPATMFPAVPGRKPPDPPFPPVVVSEAQQRELTPLFTQAEQVDELCQSANARDLVLRAYQLGRLHGRAGGGVW